MSGDAKAVANGGSNAATAPDGSSGAEPDGVKRLDVPVQASIGRLLRRHYADLVAAPLPPSIVELFDELERREQGEQSRSEGETKGE